MSVKNVLIRFGRLSLPKLSGIAIGVGLAGLVTIKICVIRKRNQLCSQDFYTKSVELLKNYPAAVEHMGSPIKASQIDLTNKYNFWSATASRLLIPVKGPKDTGTLFTKCTREPGEKWQVNRLDIKLDKLDKSWMFYQRNKTEKPVVDTETGQDKKVAGSKAEKLEYL